MKTGMNGKFFRTAVFVLSVFVLSVCSGPLRARAEAAEQEMTFVLLTDVSNTMSKSDTRGLGKDAMSMFLDLLPAEKTRAGILTFGHNNAKNAYPYADAFLPTTPEHPAFVHSVSEPVNLGEQKQQLKTAIRDIVWNGEQTVIEAALLAGCDMLTAAETKDNAGCLILLTDGDYKSRYITDVQHVQDDLDRAVAVLNENGWYVYCIELDYAGTAAARASSHAFLTEKITDRCNGATWQVEDAGDVGTAFLEIINNLYGTGSMETGTGDADGYCSREFPVGDLTSETDITVICGELKGAELLRDGETAAVIGSFSSDTDETSYDKTLFEVSLGKTYCNIKRLLPEQGSWCIRVRAEAGSQVVTNVVTYSELTVESEITPADTSAGKPLSKADSVSASLSIRYRGQNVSRDSLGSAKAYVEFSNLTTGEQLNSHTMDWDEAQSAFTAEIPVSELGRAGELSAVCVLKFGDGEFRKGKEVRIFTKNDPLTCTDAAPVTLEGALRTEAGPVDLSGKFRNPDGDPVLAELVFPEGSTDASAVFSEDGKSLTVNTGNIPGTFEGELLLYDADMGTENALRIPVQLTVPNTPMEMKEIRKVDLLSAHLLETTVDLSDYFEDADQETILFRTEGGDPAVAELSVNGNLLTVRALGDGSAEFTVCAADDDGTEYRNTFTVTGATESSIRSRKLREFWEKAGALALLAGILAFGALLAVLFVKTNTKLRGTWKIVIGAPGKKDYSYELNTATDVARKDRKKGVLRRVLDLESLPAEHPAVAALLACSEQLNYVKLTGVFRENGCRISARGRVRMFVNGEERAEAKLGSRDEAMLLIPDENGETAVSVRITI